MCARTTIVMDTFKYYALIVMFAALVCVQNNPEAAPGAPCTEVDTTNCTTTEECVGTNCICRQDYYPNGAVCSPKKGYGQSCTTDAECSIHPCISTQSGGSFCLCAISTYWDGSTCENLSTLKPTLTLSDPSVTTILASWSAPAASFYTTQYTLIWKLTSTDAQVDTLSTTDTSYTIPSLTGGTEYTVSIARIITETVGSRVQTIPGEDKTKWTKNGYNQPCDANILCNDANTSCYNGICRCSAGFYWSSECKNIDGLKPTAVFAYVTGTTSMYANWTAPDNSVITGYGVTISPSDGVITPSTGTKTATISGLTPGKEYTVSVKSMITYLQGRDEETTPTNASQRRTIPATTSGFLKKSLNEPEIQLWFHKAVGVVSRYTVRLERDGYSRETPVAPSGDILNVTFTNVTAGLYYNVTIITNSVDKKSEPFTEIVRVTAEQSGEVAQLMSGIVTSRSIHVSWAKPTEPKGIIYQYTIEVLNGTKCAQIIILNCTQCSREGVTNGDTNAVCNTTITIPVDGIDTATHNITDLLPLTQYTLKVAAYNEEGKGMTTSINPITAPEAARAPKFIRSTSTTSDTITLMWEPETPRPGITNYEITVYEKIEDREGFEVIGNRTILGYYNQSLVITNLSSYWEYYFAIQAYTHIPPRSPIVISQPVTTNESAPTEVEYIETDKVEGKFNMVRVKWKCPKQKDGRNGVIKSANLTYYPLETTVEPTISATKIYINDKNCEWEEEVEVTPEYTYRFTVSLINQYSGGDNSTNRSIPAGPPFHGRQVSIRINGQSDSQTSVPVVLSPKALYDRMNGRVILTGVVVCKGNCPSRKRRQGENREYYGNFSTWKTSKSNDFKSPYRATTDDWIDDKKGENEVTFTVGNNASCDSASEKEFCNGQLPPGTTFNIYVFACTSVGCSETDKISVSTKEIPTNIGLIAGAVGGVVAAIIIIIIVVLVVRYMRRPQTTKLDPEDTEEELIVKKRPTRICNFEKKVEEMHKDSNLLFSEEFEDINALSPKHPCVASETGGNKLKNRYVNILPFDHSRVKLLPTEEDEEETDYINGNYIPGYRSQREYIATQGPMTGTVNDFWRMIWEQNVPIIVMLSDLSEKGKPKVDRYYPENMEPVQYGDIIVEMTNFSPLNKYVIRIFKLQLGDEIRMVRHYFLPGWQDFGANLTSDDVINFLKSVRMEIKPNNQGPLCIHCSAGVGRTGTYITLDVFQQYIDEEDMNKEMDIFDFTMKMRNNRSYMIQTEKQYIFVHDTIKEMIIRKKKEMSERDHIYQNHNTDDNNVYENQAFEADPQDIYMNVDSTGKPTTAL